MKRNSSRVYAIGVGVECSCRYMYTGEGGRRKRCNDSERVEFDWRTISGKEGGYMHFSWYTVSRDDPWPWPCPNTIPPIPESMVFPTMFPTHAWNR